MKTFVICLVWLTLLGNMLLAADEPTAVLTQTEKVPAKVESTADRDARMKWWREACLLYTSPSPRDATLSRMPSSA